MSDIPFGPLTALCVGSSFAFSGLFYHLYREKTKEIEQLETIPVFQPGEDLVKLVKSTTHKRLLYAAVEGVVQPDGKPLDSQYVPRCFGVVQRVVEEERWQVWNNITQMWGREARNRRETNNWVPFSLVSRGELLSSACVRVHSPLKAGGQYLEQVHRRVRRALGDPLWLMGDRPEEMVESEEMLRVGTLLTGFGELVLGDGGILLLKPPRDGRSFLLIPGSHQSFMRRQHGSAGLWRVLAAVCGLAGAALLVWTLYRSYRQERDTRRGD